MKQGVKIMSYLIKDTTKQERIKLIRSWVPEDEVMDGCDIDLWEMYRDYIDGKREIAEINASFNEGFYEESDMR
jgi:hypothetical protein